MAENKQYIRLIIEDDSESRQFLIATLWRDHLDAEETFTHLMRALDAYRAEKTTEDANHG